MSAIPHIPDLNELARYRPLCADLAGQLDDAVGIARARDVLSELEGIARTVDAAYHAAGGRIHEAPGLELVFTLAGADELSVAIDVIDDRDEVPA